MEKNLINQLVNNPLENPLLTHKQIDITALYNRAKEIIKNAEKNIDASLEAVDELVTIQNNFQSSNNQEGIAFSDKGQAIVYQKRAQNAPDINEKLKNLKLAHERINAAVLRSNNLGKTPPSLNKRLGMIKCEIADCQHRLWNHQEANQIESEGLKILNRLISQNEAYPEARLELASASFNKIKWSLRKILKDLEKCEAHFNTPIQFKNLPDKSELVLYADRINKMRNEIKKIIE